MSYRGLCHAHAEQFRKTGELAPLFSTRRPKGAHLLRDSEGRKQCATCREWKTEDSYVANRRFADLLSNICRACKKAQHNPARARATHLLRKYNITSERYEELLAAQGGGCGVCGTTDSGGRDFAVDHDHSCCPGKESCGECVRGLLCSGCNCGIGMLGDDPDRILAAAIYVMSHSREAVSA